MSNNFGGIPAKEPDSGVESGWTGEGGGEAFEEEEDDDEDEDEDDPGEEERDRGREGGFKERMVPGGDKNSSSCPAKSFRDDFKSEEGEEEFLLSPLR